MRTFSKRLLVLVAVLGVLASACGVLGFGGNALTITAKFPNTFNLFEGSVVRVAGVDVGEITRVEVPEGATHVTVEMQIASDVDVPAGARAVIVPEALLGERYVQLDPPYDGGPKLEDGAVIPPERTGVPTEFDEVLDQLNEFLNALPEDEVARLVENLSTVLDGRGAQLGRTLESIEQMVDALRDSDDELVELASNLSDVNETIASRDEEIGALIEDFNAVATTLADNRDTIEAALDALVRLTDELGDLLVDHRGDLEDDLATLTRLGRTAVRNIDHLENTLFYQKELFRGARRVVDRDHNWLPLVEQFDQLGSLIADRVADRIVGLCLRLGVAQCDALNELDQLPDEICFDPVLPCENASAEAVPLGEALDDVIRDIPELNESLEEEGRNVRDLVDELGEGDESSGGDESGSPSPSPSTSPSSADEGPLPEPSVTEPSVPGTGGGF